MSRKNEAIIKMNNVQQLIDKAHETGKQQGLEFAHKFDLAITHVQTSLAYIAALSNANNGEKTQRSMQTAKTTLIRALDELETVLIDLDRTKGFIVHHEKLAGWISDIKKVREQIVEYLKNPTPDNLDEISKLYVELYPEGFTSARDAIIDITDNRGRNPDKIKIAIGKLAIALGEPQKRKTWKQGEKIYQELFNIPENMRSDEQQEMINYLSLYMYPNETEVARSERRSCGKFIQEARKTAIKSGN